MADQTRLNRPDLSSVFFAVLRWLAMLCFAFYACTSMLAGTDTFKAMAAGRHHLNHGVTTGDPFSEDSCRPGPAPRDIQSWPAWAGRLADILGFDAVRFWHPTGWINQNWLAGVLLYWLAHCSHFADASSLSYNSLLGLKVLIYIIVTICLYYTAITLGVHRSLAAALACLAMFVGRTFFQIRPADFTNLCTALLVLILALAAYRNVIYIWLAVPIFALWSNLHGGFFFGLAVILLFTFANLGVSFAPRRFTSIGRKGVIHSFAATFVSLVAVVLLSPYRLANLTHALVVTLGKDAKHWQITEEWASAFAANSPVGDSLPFVIISAFAVILLVVWLTVHRVRKSNLNPAFILMAALAIYMAARHRRFIPLAAIAACPLIARFLTDIILVRPLSYPLRLGLAVMTTVVLFSLGVFWTFKFKRVYLDPWPADSKLVSVFMRMTGSWAEPFDAAAFLSRNKIKGKIFCYAVAGDFLEYAQQPDPVTGRTPVQVFMDSRAQTAFDIDSYKRYEQIIHAGPTAILNRKLAEDDLARIARWLDIQLKHHAVSIVLMPSDMWEKSFVLALEKAPDWCLVYLDNRQKLFVDSSAPQGRDLSDGILTGQTLYPTEFSRNLVTARYLLAAQTTAQRKQGLDCVIKAFQENPSPEPLKLALDASRLPQLKSQVDAFCTDWLRQFEEDAVQYRRQSGYYDKIWAAMMAANYLQINAQQENQPDLAASYAGKFSKYKRERDRLQPGKTW